MALVRSLKWLYNRLTELGKNANALKADADVNMTAVKTNLKLLETEWTDYRSTPGLDKDDAEVSKLQDDIEDLHFKIRARLVKLEMSGASMQSMSNPSNVTLENILELTQTLKQHETSELPKVNIPPFYGDYTQFPSFKDIFEVSIHNKANIPKVKKLQYLKTLLRGDAELILKNVSVTEANYESAWKTVNDRFYKKGRTANELIRRFMEQRTAAASNADQLRRLHTSATEVINGLKNLGTEAETRDIWFVYILLEKSDRATLEAWTSYNEDEFPSINKVLTFLGRRCENLETCDVLRRQRAERPPVNINKQAVRGLQLNTERKPIICVICKEDHYLASCQQFKALTIEKRRDLVKNQRLCFNCLSSAHSVYECKSKYVCRQCRRHHHTLLHEVNSTPAATTSNTSTATLSDDTSDCKQLNIASHSSSISQFHAILPTAIIHVPDCNGKITKCRALLDSGSQASFITESCSQKLNLKRQNARLSITGLSTSGIITRGRSSIKVSSSHSDEEVVINVLIIEKINSTLPSSRIDRSLLPDFTTFNLADPEFDNPQEIDILIGADHFFSILRPGQHLYEKGLVLQNTLFGWIVAGTSGSHHTTITNYHIELDDTELNIDKTLKKFWELEAIPQSHPLLTEEEQFCEDHFMSTVKQHESGQYIVQLPIDTTKQLGSSKSAAIKRLQAMERKFNKNPKFFQAYSEFLKEYEELNHMKIIKEVNFNEYFLPHHAVMKEDSTTTKFRVVFDGSSKTSNGMSLNDILKVGPVCQRDLFSVLINFRWHKIAMSADIEKMYRQILVDKQHQPYQSILWRENEHQPMQKYQLQTITYGTSSAPFLATRVLKHLATANMASYPEAAKVILNDFYVDDLLTGAADIHSAQKLKSSLTDILTSAHFNLRKWTSNSPQLLEVAHSPDFTAAPIELDKTMGVKVLGLNWHQYGDTFKFKVSQPLQEEITTKRSLLSEASKVFDPLGWLSPYTINAKIIFQQLWLQELSWDDPLPEDVQNKWNAFKQNLSFISDIKIPRWLHTTNSAIQLHGFSDASEVAYAAAVYLRVHVNEEDVQVHLVTAKTRVAPIKQVSLPRLELNAAHPLVKLIHSVEEALKLKHHEIFCWTDSTIVLAWLSAHPRKWTTFVANRVSDIVDVVPKRYWHHVSSTCNPADCASRGITPQQLRDHHLWWEGPLWLRKEASHWPCNKNVILDEIPEQRKTKIIDQVNSNHTKITDDNVISKLFREVSSFSKILRIIVRCKQFLKKKKGQTITAPEIQDATTTCIKWAQHDMYFEEQQCLQRKLPIHKRSKLLKLTPFLDDQGVIRVGGRIQNSLHSFNTKHPIILSKEHPFAIKLADYLHQRYLHPSNSLMMSIIRQDYWVFGVRDLIKKSINNCITCTRYKRQPAIQQMGVLPAARVTPSRPFQRVGVDFASPITIRFNRGRGSKTTKGYIAIFVCFAIKAVHIELVSDLTADAFIAALRRFSSRRGCPSDIYSDNWANFIGANRKLKEMHGFYLEEAKTSNIHSFLAEQGIQWHFIPPSSPNFGGLWEAGVKAAKSHLKRVIGESSMTFEEYNTLLVQIEGLLNSRPLIPVYPDEHDDLSILTPAHFLIGEPLTTVPAPFKDEEKLSTLSRWNLIQALYKGFWDKWHHDYITNLQQRPKWQQPQANYKVGDLVLLRESNIPPAAWPRGRITAVHPGKDNLVRVATIKTSTSEIKRPVSKFSKLFSIDI